VADVFIVPLKADMDAFRVTPQQRR